MRSSHADILDPELNKACRAITACLKPTYVEDLYLLAGIAPPDIRRDVCARIDPKQTDGTRDSLLTFTARSHLKSRNDVLTSEKPSYFPAKVIRCNEWQRIVKDKSRLAMVNLNEEQAKGYTCSKEQRKKWDYFNGNTTSACGQAAEKTAHMLQCSL